jgi:hypothetical protein
MALTATITYVKGDGGGPIRVGFNAVLSGNYPTGGDTVNLATALPDPNFVGLCPAVESLGPPIDFDCWDVSGQITYVVAPTIGATPAAAGKVRLATALTTELANGAYPGSATSMKLQGEAVFNKQ